MVKMCMLVHIAAHLSLVSPPRLESRICSKRSKRKEPLVAGVGGKVEEEACTGNAVWEEEREAILDIRILSG